jgi:hypothetical protein
VSKLFAGEMVEAFNAWLRICGRHHACGTPACLQLIIDVAFMLQEKLFPKYTATLQKMTSLAAEVAQQQLTSPSRQGLYRKGCLTVRRLIINVLCMPPRDG